MATKDLHSKIRVVTALAPVSVANTAAQTGATIDLQGYESCEFAIQPGALFAASVFAVKLQHGDLANGSDMADVAAADLLGTAAAASFVAADANVARKLGYRGTKRYVRIVITPTTNGGASLLAATALLSHARNQPAA